MIKSQAEDLSVFWAEEANESILQEFVAFKVVAAEFSEETYKPQVGSRGVTTKDRRKSLHVARFDALQQAAVSQQVMDAQMWAALRHHYTKAEESATDGFRCSMFFLSHGEEPSRSHG